MEKNNSLEKIFNSWGEKDENTRLELQAKYKRVLEAYNKEFQKIIELKNKQMGRSSMPRITYTKSRVAELILNINI